MSHTAFTQPRYIEIEEHDYVGIAANNPGSQAKDPSRFASFTNHKGRCVMANEQFPQLPVLLVDDEAPCLVSQRVTLTSAGIGNIVECQDSREVMPLLENRVFQLIVMNMGMPHVSGWDLLPQIVARYRQTPVVITSASDNAETAVRSLKSGAFDYLVKPVDDSRFVTTIRRAIGLREMLDDNGGLKRQSLLSKRPAHPEAFADILTMHEDMWSIFQYLEAISKTQLPLLITGETGVGKEMIANAVHRLSLRSGELVTLNVAGVDDSLFSDTLFGHKRGGFTGAERDRKGLVEQASGGTLFLDEIGDLSMESQLKLLRLLQEGKYYSIGSDVVKLTDARFIVATNKDLDVMQQNGRFRKDLYYRLHAHHVSIPPLRSRREDIPLLVNHFLERAAAAFGKEKPAIATDLLTMFKSHPFDGNIRELEGMIFDLVARNEGGVLSLESSFIDAPLAEFRPDSMDREEIGERRTTDRPVFFTDQFPTLSEIEKLAIEEAMARSSGNQARAAKLLGLSRRALNNRMRRQRAAA